jgi:hypothetical protein
MLAAGAILAGCASSGSGANGLAAKTPGAIVAAAKAAAAGAATVHVAGSILAGGTPISVDMWLVSGKGGKGRIMLEGLSVDLIDVHDDLYINSGDSFYSRFAGPAAARRLAGRWLMGSARDSALSALGSLTDLPELLDRALSSHGALSRGASATVGGQEALAVTDHADGGTLYVASIGTPYPLAIVEHGSRRGRLTFDKWNQAVTLEPPAGAIDVTHLQDGD